MLSEEWAGALVGVKSAIRFLMTLHEYELSYNCQQRRSRPWHGARRGESRALDGTLRNITLQENDENEN